MTLCDLIGGHQRFGEALGVGVKMETIDTHLLNVGDHVLSEQHGATVHNAAVNVILQFICMLADIKAIHHTKLHVETSVNW
jgi:hypothetical protein